MAISIHAADATAYRVLSLRTKLNKTHVVVAAHSVLIKKDLIRATSVRSAPCYKEQDHE